MKDLNRRKEAFRIYLKTGNISETARQVGLKKHVVYNWSLTDQWKHQREELSKKVQIHVNITKQLDPSELLRKCLKELEFLNLLQSQVSQAILSSEIRMTTWADVLATQKFIAEREAIIRESISKIDPATVQKIVDEAKAADIKPTKATKETDEEDILPVKAIEGKLTAPSVEELTKHLNAGIK